MNESDSTTAYTSYIDNLITDLQDEHSYDEIMQLAVGGDFEMIGILELEYLLRSGLKKEGYVIDVGCGSGRLAQPLSQYLHGRYLGIDIVPKLVKYAADKINRTDWRFEVAKGLSIPERDGEADFVCFFSVFTHLRHEETFLYLQEAKRVLKPTGKIIFSFLEFPNRYNWSVFEHNMATANEDRPLNQFMSVDAIQIWAYHLGLTVNEINRAGKIKMSQAYPLQDDRTYTGTNYFGQSVCVLSAAPQTKWKQRINDFLFSLGNRLQTVRW